MNTNLPSNEINNTFEIFNYKNLGSVRCYIDQFGEKWFCHKDVCDILGIVNSRDASSRLNPKGVIVTDTLTNGGVQKLTFINEGNLMELIFTSRKPEAKEFRAWVCQEVLPSLSKTGSYHMPNKAMTEMEMIHTISGEVIKNTNDIKELQTNVKKNAQTLELHKKYIMIILKEGYYTVASAAKLVGVPLSLETAREIGALASEQCQDRGLSVATIPHPEYGRVRAYPYFVIADVLKNYIN